MKSNIYSCCSTSHFFWLRRAQKNPYQFDLHFVQKIVISVNPTVIAQNYVSSLHTNSSCLMSRDNLKLTLETSS